MSRLTTLQMLTTLAILAMTAAPATGTAQPTYVPGNFGSGEKTLAELIEFPEMRGDVSVAIYCIGVLTSKGKLDKHGCFRRDPGDETFGAAIYKAADKARLQPATYNGKPVSVIFQYRVLFIQKGEDKTLRFVANPGYAENVEAYGHDHIAAQRLYDGERWQKACPKQASFTVLARANVDYDGTPAAASVEHIQGLVITERCQQAIIDAILASRFIPAMDDGEPVPSTFVQRFGN